jgi:hypothetical protein
MLMSYPIMPRNPTMSLLLVMRLLRVVRLMRLMRELVLDVHLHEPLVAAPSIHHTMLVWLLALVEYIECKM